jgi:hypothetical protein
MAILIISSNPLLVESLSESLSKSLKTALDSAAPEEALQLSRFLPGDLR